MPNNIQNLRPEDGRRELKFCFPVALRSHIEHYLLLSPFNFRQPYEDRWVNSLYFDTIDLASYKENLSGHLKRSKLRLRWYGTLGSAKEFTIETKIKHNQYGWKKQTPISFSMDLQSADIKGLISRMSNHCDQETQLQLQQTPNAVLLCRYKRRYFSSFDENIRMTIDEELQYYDQRKCQMINLNDHEIIPDISVLECKFSPEFSTQAKELLSNLPVRPIKMSKYVFGLGHMA